MDTDVVVVGGGAAGLSGAVVLARSRRSVLVIDSGEPRNAPAAGVHGFLTRDGIAPRELVRLGADELKSYGGQLRSGAVSSARAVEGGFVVTLDDGSEVSSRRLLVATGLVDELPEVPGLRERWGKDVVHCPYCHGWEIRDQRVAVLATSPLAMHQVTLFSQLTGDLTLLLNDQPDPDDDALRTLDALGARAVPGLVQRVVVADDRITGVEVAGGEVVPCDAVVVGARVSVRSAVLESLGVMPEPLMVGDVEAGTYVPADSTGLTAVPGVYVAGNVTTPMAQVVHAAGSGVWAGAMVNMDLIQEDLAPKLR